MAMREIPPVTNMSTLMYNFFIGAINFARKEWENILKNRSSVRAVFELGLGPCLLLAPGCGNYRIHDDTLGLLWAKADPI